MVKRLHPDHPVVGVGAIILKQGNILLEKRGNDPAKGKWSIPGGVVEVGEHLEEAVLRETLIGNRSNERKSSTNRRR